MNQLTQAILFATKKHERQTRKSTGVPYIVHPIDVLNILATAGVRDVEILQAAVLHDTVEDTQTTLEEITATFGNRVGFIVSKVTDDKSLPKVERKSMQIEHARTAPYGVCLVKIADKISNLRDLKQGPPPQGWTVEYVQGYFLWSRAVVTAMSLQNLLEPTALQLLNTFSEACSGTFVVDGVAYPCISETMTLEDYYKLC